MCRYEQFGLQGLEDRPRAGRSLRVDADKQHEVLARTLVPPPEELSVTHWSSRLLGK